MSKKGNDDTTNVRIPPGMPADPSESFNPGEAAIRMLLFSNQEQDDTHEVHSEVVHLGNILAPTASRTEFDAPMPAIDVNPGYEFLRLVGQGGFGEVWEATQNALGRTIAVKCLRPDRLQGVEPGSQLAEHLNLSFRQEALTTGALEHPNIVPVYDLGVDKNGQPLMAMKLVRGQQWDDVIERDFNLPEHEFLALHLPVLIDVAQAVAFAHSRGVVHRDIKPSQIMLGEFGEVLLMDWGLALVFDPAKAELQGPQLALSEFTPWSPHVNSPAGTPSYMAPEQTEEAAVDVGPWTDVYLLGGCLYYLLTGYAPHEDESSEKSFQHAVIGAVTPPAVRAPDRLVPPELSELSLRALSREQRQRPSAKEFIKGLKDYLTGAGKRREALALLEEAQQMAQQSWESFADYESLAQATNLLERALILDPQNKNARQLRQQVILRFSRIAISNNDLRLARFQAERLEQGTPEREKVLKEIETLTQKQSKARKSIEQLYARALRERDQSEDRRSRSEELIGQGLFHLFKMLEPSGRGGLLRPFALEALEYFTNEPERIPTKRNVRSRIASFRAIGDVLRVAGPRDEALRAYRLAEELLQGFLSHDPNDEVFTHDLAEIREKIELVEESDHESEEDQKIFEEFHSMRNELIDMLDQLLDEK